MPTLSRAQQRTIAAIALLTGRFGHPPTMQDIADEIGTAKSTAWRYVCQLEQRGRVAREPCPSGSRRKKTRTIHIVEHEAGGERA